MNGWELAAVNVARMLAPLDSPTMAAFTAQIEAINAVADAAPGFVWRLQTPPGDTPSPRPDADDMLLVNLSVWRDAEALHAYVYRSAHAGVMARRREWFARMAEVFVAMWWVPAGERPGEEEAMERLRRLRRDGPTPQAFGFRQAFPPPGVPLSPE